MYYLRNRGGVFMRRFLNKGPEKKDLGSSVLEFALTFPVVIYLIFFIIEILRLKDVQTSVDSIAEECATQFMVSKSTTLPSSDTDGAMNFDKIIDKYLPKYIPRKDLTYYFTIFESPKALYENTSNIAVYWPVSESTAVANSGEVIRNSGVESPNGTVELKNYKRPELGFSQDKKDKNILLTRKAFVLTVVLRYTFSSAFVGKLFAGGSNVENSPDTFLVWSRATGICR